MLLYQSLTNDTNQFSSFARIRSSWQISCGILRMRKYANLFFFCSWEGKATYIWIIMETDGERRKNLEELRERRKRKILDNASLRMEKLKGGCKQ